MLGIRRSPRLALRKYPNAGKNPVVASGRSSNAAKSRTGSFADGGGDNLLMVARMKGMQVSINCPAKIINKKTLMCDYAKKQAKSKSSTKRSKGKFDTPMYMMKQLDNKVKQNSDDNIKYISDMILGDDLDTKIKSIYNLRSKTLSSSDSMVKSIISKKSNRISVKKSNIPETSINSDQEHISIPEKKSHYNLRTHADMRSNASANSVRVNNSSIVNDIRKKELKKTDILKDNKNVKNVKNINIKPIKSKKECVNTKIHNEYTFIPTIIHDQKITEYNKLSIVQSEDIIDLETRKPQNKKISHSTRNLRKTKLTLSNISKDSKNNKKVNSEKNVEVISNYIYDNTRKEISINKKGCKQNNHELINTANDKLGFTIQEKRRIEEAGIVQANDFSQLSSCNLNRKETNISNTYDSKKMAPIQGNTDKINTEIYRSDKTKSYIDGVYSEPMYTTKQINSNIYRKNKLRPRINQGQREQYREKSINNNILIARQEKRIAEEARKPHLKNCSLSPLDTFDRNLRKTKLAFPSYKSKNKIVEQMKNTLKNSMFNKYNLTEDSINTRPIHKKCILFKERVFDPSSPQRKNEHVKSAYAKLANHRKCHFNEISQHGLVPQIRDIRKTKLTPSSIYKEKNNSEIVKTSLKKNARIIKKSRYSNSHVDMKDIYSSSKVHRKREQELTKSAYHKLAIARQEKRIANEIRKLRIEEMSKSRVSPSRTNRPKSPVLMTRTLSQNIAEANRTYQQNQQKTKQSRGRITLDKLPDGLQPHASSSQRAIAIAGYNLRLRDAVRRSSINCSFAKPMDRNGPEYLVQHVSGYNPLHRPRGEYSGDIDPTTCYGANYASRFPTMI